MNIFIFWKPAVEILILWFVFYHIMLFFEGTRAIQVLRGIIILVIAFLLFQKLDLMVVNWLMAKLFAISIIALLIIFHPEIRQGLARLGQRELFSTALRKEELDYILNQIINAAENLSRDKVGALIAIEKNDSLAAYIESGALVDARVSTDLIQTIFTPNSLLHDGGLIIRHDRIIAAGCLFPPTQNYDLNRIYGMRHRAAIGLSEETDAIIVIISEERHDISLVYRGRLYESLTKDGILMRIKEIIKIKKDDTQKTI